MTVPLSQKFTLDVTSLTTSMNLNAILAGPMPFAGTVTGVQYVPNATQAGGIDVNHRMLRVFNRGAAGTATASVAVLDLTSANANGTLIDNSAASFSLATSTALLAFTAGDVFEYQSSMSATGMNDPGGRAILSVSRAIS